MKIYLDHAATAYTDERVYEQMRPFFTEAFGNASSIHQHGKTAGRAVAESRLQVARALGAHPGEIYFTSGGTESDNWAICGMARAAGKGHIVTSCVEHPAVLSACRRLEADGFRVTYAPVDSEGRVRAESVENSIRDDTFLISIMYANNETGVIMPIRQIGEIARKRNIAFHVDAVQAFGHIPIDVDACGIDLLSISAHKLYGPKGVGALYIRSGVSPENLIYGGAQESGLRAGTYNTPGIVGLGCAAALAADEMERNAAHERALVERLISGLRELSGIRVNGHLADRLPGHLNLLFGGSAPGSMMIYLDQMGVSASGGSACAAGTAAPSYVLTQMGLTPAEARASVRFSMGRCNRPEEIDRLIDAIKTFYSLYVK